MRVKATISYDGSRFFGSQIQPDKVTVAGELQRAFHKISIDSKVVMSSRTDRGVHAVNQVFHIDIDDFWLSRLQHLETFINRRVFPSIKIEKLQKVEDNFHARFSATERVYRYIFSTDEPDPFKANFVSFIQLKNFDFQRVVKGITLFKGEHNFKNFSKNGSEPASEIRKIYEVRAYRRGNIYILKFRANSFLRSQVRLMVASLLKLGEGKIEEKDILEKLNLERDFHLKPAPENGLYLWKIGYKVGSK
jgi:tRNA pseudouridine38-40 synthase